MWWSIITLSNDLVNLYGSHAEVQLLLKSLVTHLTIWLNQNERTRNTYRINEDEPARRLSCYSHFHSVTACICIHSLIFVGCRKMDIITRHLIQDELAVTFAENVMKTIWFSKRYCLSHVLHITAKLKRLTERMFRQIRTRCETWIFWCASNYYYLLLLYHACQLWINKLDRIWHNTALGDVSCLVFCKQFLNM